MIKKKTATRKASAKTATRKPANALTAQPESARKAGRKPGRPSKIDSQEWSREEVIRHGMELATDMPMDAISIVRLARELHVTPALIHYYLDGGRDSLTSGIINRFYGVVLKKWPRSTDDWQDSITRVSRHIYRQLILFPGIASYLNMHNRFRVFQMVGPGERDNGVLFLEKFIGVLREAGLSDERSGIHAHLLMEFLLSSAHSTAHYRWPREHIAFLEEQLKALDPAMFPNLAATGYLVGRLDARQAFENGLQIYLASMATERNASIKPNRK